jgi:hypothetical protein
MFRANFCLALRVHVVLSSSAQKTCLPHQQDIIPYVVKISVSRSWRWAKVCPKHVELILEINKTVIVASSWCSILLYLHMLKCTRWACEDEWLFVSCTWKIIRNRALILEINISSSTVTKKVHILKINEWYIIINLHMSTRCIPFVMYRIYTMEFVGEH